LLETLPGNWADACALVQLAIPFTLAFRFPAHATTSRRREKFAYQIIQPQMEVLLRPNRD
jgi:hypothetical protein